MEGIVELVELPDRLSWGGFFQNAPADTSPGSILVVGRALTRRLCGESITTHFSMFMQLVELSLAREDLGTRSRQSQPTLLHTLMRLSRLAGRGVERLHL